MPTYKGGMMMTAVGTATTEPTAQQNWRSASRVMVRVRVRVRDYFRGESAWG